MNNKEFINELSARMGYSTSDTQRLVTNMVNAMSDSFLEGAASASARMFLIALITAMDASSSFTSPE